MIDVRDANYSNERFMSHSKSDVKIFISNRDRGRFCSTAFRPTEVHKKGNYSKTFHLIAGHHSA